MKNGIRIIIGFCAGVLAASALALGLFINYNRTIISPASQGEFPAIMEVYNRLRAMHYFYEEGDSPDLVEGAIQGMIDALGDPYSTFFTMEEFEGFTEHLGGAFYGIGAEVTTISGEITIVAPMPHSPAEEAGVLPNDIVIEVDGNDVTGQSLQAVISQIRGPEGSEVVLGIIRAGSPEPLEITIIRGRIAQETVRYHMIEGTSVGYVQVTTFGENTAREFEDAIEALEAEGMEALMVDLRNNGGGYMQAVTQMVDYLLPEGKRIVRSQDRTGAGNDHMTTDRTPGKDYPIVTLINGGSASASEIFAAAMKEAGGQPVVGTTSFGKGTVQVTLPLDERSMLKITTQSWLTSDGNWINEVGVEPTLFVEAPEFYSFFQVALPDGEALEFDQVSLAIQNAQRILEALGYQEDRTDGYFDQATLEAVKAFQENQGLEINGMIDGDTARALTMALREKIRDDAYDSQLQAALELLGEQE